MKFKIARWQKNSSKTIADCRVFKVREDFSEHPETGQKASFFVIENPDWVNVFALTKDRKLVLIEQFRHGTGDITLEIPGGMVDPGENPSEAAVRELSEETGFTAEEFIPLGKSAPNPALQQNRIFHFFAVNCEKTVETGFDEHEEIGVRLVDLEKIPDLIESEEITHSLVIAGFYRLEKFLEKNL